MANFNLFGPKILEIEGGFVNHPNDPGGATNMGITWGTYQQWADELGAPNTFAAFQNMDEDTALTIYELGYWDAIQGDAIQNQSVAEIICDARINHPGTAVRIAQLLLQVAPDNVMGPITLAALNAANPQWFVNEYRKARESYYYYRANAGDEAPQGIDYAGWANVFAQWGIDQYNSMQVFLQGWLNRLDHFPYARIAGGAIATMLLLAWYFQKRESKIAGRKHRMNLHKNQKRRNA